MLISGDALSTLQSFAKKWEGQVPILYTSYCDVLYELFLGEREREGERGRERERERERDCFCGDCFLWRAEKEAAGGTR